MESHANIRTWCVLRTAARNTLSLAEALARDGFGVWAPKGLSDQLEEMLDQAARRPRSRSRRKRVAGDELVPILPTFVFALGHHLDDLIFMSENGDFSIMYDRADRRGFALITDAALSPLRELEDDLKDDAERKRPRPSVLPFQEGEEIRVPSGAYEGLSGIVRSSDGKKTWLDFGGVMGRVQIETFVLRPDGAEKMAA